MKKGFSFSLAFLIVLVFVHVGLTKAISSQVSVNGDHKGCGGAAAEDCLIGNYWEETEFSLDSHSARMLYDVAKSVTGKTPNRNSPAVNGPVSQGYRSSLPPSNGGAKRQPCADYTRTC